jgi:hypothetical protein
MLGMEAAASALVVQPDTSERGQLLNLPPRLRLLYLARGRHQTGDVYS